MIDPQLDRTLEDLVAARLRPDDWDALADLLERAVHGDDIGDQLATALFEARVHGRFRGGRTSSAIEPTKQVSALPWVGLVCAGLLFGVGALLGGGVILVGIGVLAVFVFGIAFAGSRLAHQNDDAVEVDDRPEPVPVPTQVRAAVETLRSRSV